MEIYVSITTCLNVNKSITHNLDGYGVVLLNYHYLFKHNSNRYGDGAPHNHHYSLKGQKTYNT